MGLTSDRLLLFLKAGYSSPTQTAITKDLGLTVSEVRMNNTSALIPCLIFFQEMLLTPRILGDSSLYLVLYRMWEQWLGQYVVVRLQIILGEKGYDRCSCYILLLFAV